MALMSMGQYMHYAAWFFKAKLGAKKPLVLTMVVNYKCNLSCKHCSIKGNYEKLPAPNVIPFDTAVAEMRHFFGEGARILFFEGGEPTLYNDNGKTLLDLIRAGKEVGYFVVGYTTNGTNVIFEESDVISVSLDGPREMHDSIRGPGTYDRLMANLDKTTHGNIFANMVVMKENVRLVRETVEAAADNKHIHGIMLNFLTPPPREQAIPLEEKKKVVELALALKDEGKPILNTRKALKEMLIEDYEDTCADWVSAFVLPDASRHYGCPLRGTEACKECGFDAVREYSLITRGSFSAIKEMSSRFAFSKE
jgi:MoaA/NifB/PqqE/SkfB family radical SAM enzyme